MTKALFPNPPSFTHDVRATEALREAQLHLQIGLVGAQVAVNVEDKPLETVNGLSFQRGGRIIHHPERALEMLQSWEVTKRRRREGIEFFHLRRPREDLA